MAAILECQIPKNQNAFLQETLWHKVELISNNGSWDIVFFRVYAILSTGPWRPSWIVNLHKVEISPSTKSKRLHTRNIRAQRWINFNQWFLRYYHFRVYAFLVTDPAGHLGLSICINMKWFHSGTIVIESDQNTFMLSWDIGICS